MKHTFELNGGENFKDIESSILIVLGTKTKFDEMEVKVDNKITNEEVIIDYEKGQFERKNIIDELIINSKKIVFEKSLKVDTLHIKYLEYIKFKNNSKIIANQFDLDNISFEALVELLTHLEIPNKNFSFNHPKIINIISGNTNEFDFSKINDYLNKYKFHLEIKEKCIKENGKLKIKNLIIQENQKILLIQNPMNDSFDLIIENCNELSIKFIRNNLWIKNLIIKNVSSIFLESDKLDIDKKRIENISFENIENIKMDTLLLMPNTKIEKIKNCKSFEIDFNNFDFKKINAFLTTNKDMLKNFENISIPVSPYIEFINFKKHSENLTLYFDYSEFFNIVNLPFDEIDYENIKNTINQTLEKFLKQFVDFKDSKKAFFVFPNVETIKEKLKLFFKNVQEINDKLIVKSIDGRNLTLMLNFVKMKQL